MEKVRMESRKRQKRGVQEYLNADESLLVSANDMLVKARQKNLLHQACHNTHTQSTHLCLRACAGGDSHIAALSGRKVPLRGDKSPPACQRLLALHPHTDKATETSTWVTFASLSLLISVFLLRSLFHPFVPLACCASGSIQN